MAAIRYGTRIDLQNNEILNMIFQKVNGLPTPTSTLTGAARFNTADGRLYVCDGSSWHLKASNADALQNLSPAQLRDRSTHTGMQPASSISDLTTTVAGMRLNDFAAPNGPVAMGNQRLTGLAAGTANTDAVTKAQLDSVANIANSAAAGVAIKAPVVAVSTTNINLASPPAAVDGITVPVNGRILVAGQTDATQNGIYTRPATGALVRATDADATGELAPGTQVYVTQGVVNGDSIWAIVSDSGITVGTVAQAWTRVPGSSGSSNTFGSGLETLGSEVRVKAGLGITVADGSVALDRSKVPLIHKQDIPAGASPVSINHGLGTPDLLRVQVRDLVTGDLVEIGATVTGANTVSLDFAINPVANQFRVAILG